MPIVWIKHRLYQKLFEETYNRLPFETGGMLLGYKDIYSNMVITNLISAGPNAIYKKRSFVPDGEYQQSELSNIYISSKRTTTYLGDWHSHPYDHSYMSWRDRKTIKKIAKTESTRESNPIFIIIGTILKEAKCWRYNDKKYKNIELLEIRIFD
jgi:integrative and conjugative element protein (TIGR02256 family)